MSGAYIYLASEVVAPTETRRLLDWLLSEYLEGPDFEWRALSALMCGSAGYGFSGFFYADDGRWSAAGFNKGMSHEAESKMFKGWIAATSAALEQARETALVQLVPIAGQLRARIEFEFDDIERWDRRDEAASPSPGDFLRPRELPTPLGDGGLPSKR